MELGLVLPQHGQLGGPETIRKVAEEAAQTGFDSVWLSDHVAVPWDSGANYPYSPTGKAPWSGERMWLDPLVGLASLVHAVPDLKLGVSALVLPMRQTLAVAKAVSTLDYLAGGRVVLAVAAGWLREEFELLGVPFEDRANRLVEAIEVLRLCWSNEVITFDGKHHQLEPFGMVPKPPQGADLPILMAGNATGALRRAVSAGTGWHPLRLSPEELRERMQELTTLVEEEGRDTHRVEVVVSVAPEAMLREAWVREYQELGVSGLLVNPDYSQPQEEISAFLEAASSTVRSVAGKG